MAIPSLSLDDIFQKRVLHDKATTDVNRKFFEEPFLARPMVLTSDIWLQSNQIPSGGTFTGVVDYISVTMSWLPGTDGCYYDPSGTVCDLIKPSVDGYKYEVFRNNGAQVSLGEADWYLDSYSGILTFFTNAVGGTVSNPNNASIIASQTAPPIVKAYKYVGKKGVIPNLSGLTYSGGTMSISWSPISGTVSLSAGSAVVNNSNVTSDSIILLTKQGDKTITSISALSVGSRVSGASFSIFSSNGADSDVIGYLIINP